MKAKKDEIDRLLATYEQTAAKRLTKIKRREDKYKAEEQAHKQFEENLRKKISGVFRPVMLKLLSRLDKSVFKIEFEKLDAKPDMGIREFYEVKARKEEYTCFCLILTTYNEGERNKACLNYFYSRDEDEEKGRSKIVNPEDIDEAFVTRYFMLCLRKICE